MRQVRVRSILAPTLVSAVLVAGCGGEEPPKGSELMKPTDTAQMKGMLGDQMKNANIKAKVPIK